MSLARTARHARNAVIAEAALAFARDRLARGSKPRRRRPGAKTLLIGGALAAGGLAIALKRDKVLALLPGHSDEPAPPEPAYTPPPVSTFEAAGPAANTAAAEEAEPAPPEEPPAAESEEGEPEEGESEGAEPAEPDQAEPAGEAGDAAPEAAADARANDSEWRTWSGRSANP